MGYTQRMPKRPRKEPRKRIIRIYSKWKRLHPDVPTPPKPKPRSPLKGFKAWKKQLKAVKVRTRRLTPPRPRGIPMRPSSEFKFKQDYYAVAYSYGYSYSGNLTVLESQRQILTRHTTPGYRSIKTKRLLPLPYEMILTKWHFGRMKTRTVLSWMGGSSSESSDYPATGIGTASHPPYVSRFSEADAILRTKALLKIKDLKVNLAQAFGERRQTVSLIAQTATRIAMSYNSLKRFQVDEAARHLGVDLHLRKRNRLERRARQFNDGTKFAANSWLEYKFGWLPLLSDVYGAAEMLAKVHNPDYNIQTVTARHQVALEPSWTRTNYGTSGKMTDEGRGVINAHIKLRFRPHTSLLGTLPNMGLNDPLLLAWELLPYSFVVDWFLPIGDYLSSLTARQGVTFVDGYIAYKAHLTSNRTVSDVYDNGNPYFRQVVSSSGQASLEKVHHLREVFVDFPTPLMPVVKDPFSASHVVTALALLRQTFRVR